MNNDFSNVLFIGPQNTYGGIGAVLRTYKNNMLHFNFIATHKGHSKIVSTLYFIYSLYKINIFLLRNNHIKIVHVHSASKGSMIRKMMITLFSLLYQKIAVFHMHGGQFKAYYSELTWSKFIFRKLLNAAHLFICLTEEWKQYYENELGIKNVLVLGNPIDVQSNLFLKPLGNELKLLFLGGINSNKGIFDLLDYLETNAYFINGKISLTIAGIGEEERLLKLINASKYKHNIQFLGFVEAQLKQSAIASCDVFILPSYFEGLPVSILEAMSHGKPVIATNVGGVASVVKVNQSGWLFDAGEFSQLDQILDEIINQKFPLKEFQINAYNIAKTFSSQNILADLSKMYNKVLN